MNNNEWLPTFGQKPQAARSLDYVWVQLTEGRVKLQSKSEYLDWKHVSHFMPTQIRNPKPCKNNFGACHEI